MNTDLSTCGCTILFFESVDFTKYKWFEMSSSWETEMLLRMNIPRAIRQTNLSRDVFLIVSFGLEKSFADFV